MRSNAIKRSIFFNEILRYNGRENGRKICSGNIENFRKNKTHLKIYIFKYMEFWFMSQSLC